MSKKKQIKHLKRRVAALEPAAQAWHAWNSKTVAEQLVALDRMPAFQRALHDDTVLQWRAMRADFNRAAFADRVRVDDREIRGLENIIRNSRGMLEMR